MPHGPIELIVMVATGVVAGILGGLLGIGGSVVMIPVLALALRVNYHLAQASAMIVNVAIALPAARRHALASAMPWKSLSRFLPAALIFMFIGVELSLRTTGRTLETIFGLFLVWIFIDGLRALTRTPTTEEPLEDRASWLPLSAIGALTGLTAGLLGVGGGVVAVPMLQKFADLRLRQAIAMSSAAICVTATVGAIRKNIGLSSLSPALGGPFEIGDSLMLALMLAPAGVVGGWLGAALTHRLPVRTIRVVFLGLVLLVSLRMAAPNLFGHPARSTPDHSAPP